jgi:O-antigen/teichoic acid export membrane protein
MSILSFVLPMAVLPFTHGLATIVSTLVAVRFVGTLAHLLVCVAVMPELGRRFRWVPEVAGSLLRSGGWLAVINLIMPLFVSLDRMLIGAFASVAAIAFYAPPQEIATKLWILPGTLVTVLFPAFATSTRGNQARVNTLFKRGLSQVFCALFPPALILIVAGGDILGVWLGATFRENGQTALQLLSTGAFFTGLAFVPSALVQAVGQPRKIGLLFMVELPLFVLGLWWGVRMAGTTGAALVWCLRALVDMVALMIIAVPSIPDGRAVVRQLALPTLGTLVVLGGAFAVRPLALPIRLAILAVVLVPFAIWALGPGLAEERRALRAALDRRT